MSNDFYKAFEDRFRGSREVIKERLRVYLPFAEPFKQTDAELKIFDIGCGRGEWLELMTESGFDAYGMDLDEGMLAECHERNLTAKQGDAVSFIQTLEKDSHIIVSAFQVVEHISFDELHVVVAEALRVLVPGGLLIMETPNPENLIVATKNFYLDPTHKKPVPPELLSFLPEYHGFERVKVLRLQESDNLLQEGHHNLYTVITGVSPDYTVIAQKAAPPAVLALFDQEFEKEHGVGLETLTTHYDQSVALGMNRLGEQTAKVASSLNDTETRAAQAEATAQHLEAELTEAREKLETLSHRTGLLESELAQKREVTEQLQSELVDTREQLSRAQSSLNETEARAAQAEATAQHLEAELAEAREKLETLSHRTGLLESELAQKRGTKEQLQAELAEAKSQITQLHESNHKWWSMADQQSNTLKAVYASWSWRITWPLRKLLDITKWICRLPVVLIRWLVRLPARFVSWMVVKAMAFAIKRDPLRLRLLAQVNKYPRLKNRLIMLGQTKGLFNQYPNSINGKGQGLKESTANNGNLDQLSPRARTIYFDLKKAIAQRQKENE